MRTYERLVFAFPVLDGPDTVYDPGMTLRQWYAGQALSMGEGVWSGNNNPQGIAEKCFAIADAMLEYEEKMP